MGTLLLLGDTISRIESFIDVFIVVYTLLILLYIIASWIRLPYSTWVNRIQRFLYDVCDPYLRLWRRLLPTFGPLDLSPVVGVAFLYIVSNILDRLR
jgi:YggT family protein